MAKPARNTQPATTTAAVVATPAATTAVVATPPAANVLQPLAPANVRGGTARAAAYTALVASVGQPHTVVLAAVKTAETQWHLAQGRVVKGVNPGGWLRLFGATFAPAATPAPAAQ